MSLRSSSQQPPGSSNPIGFSRESKMSGRICNRATNSQASSIEFKFDFTKNLRAQFKFDFTKICEPSSSSFQFFKFKDFCFSCLAKMSRVQRVGVGIPGLQPARAIR